MKRLAVSVLSIAIATTFAACSMETKEDALHEQVQQEAQIAGIGAYSCVQPRVFYFKQDCVHSRFEWRDRPHWPVRNLVIGSENYDKRELRAILRTEPWGDVSITLAHQLIAAKLNVAAGAHTSVEVALTIAVANRWMIQNRDVDNRLPFATPTGSEQTRALLLARSLTVFNQGGAGTESCE